MCKKRILQHPVGLFVIYNYECKSVEFMLTKMVCKNIVDVLTHHCMYRLNNKISPFSVQDN